MSEVVLYTLTGERTERGYTKVELADIEASKPSANELIMQQIAGLESTATERRYREAVLGIDEGWLKNLNDEIASLRAQLKQ